MAVTSSSRERNIRCDTSADYITCRDCEGDALVPTEESETRYLTRSYDDKDLQDMKGKGDCVQKPQSDWGLHVIDGGNSEMSIKKGRVGNWEPGGQLQRVGTHSIAPGRDDRKDTKIGRAHV